MINLEQTFTPRVNPADTNYPFGSLKDNTSPGANDGTPLSAVWGNDWEGFAQAAMTEAGIVPSGLPDTAQDSQLLDAVKFAAGAPVSREALRRSYAEAGFTLVGGSFEEGGTLTSTTDVLLHKASGIAYSWDGVFPQVVAASSTPTPIGSGGWIDRSDVTAASSVTAHETKLGAHAISGVAGLQAALDGNASSVAAIDTRVTALETRKSTCLVNAVGTGAPHETVSAALPANISLNSRYVLTNPFGANVPVECWAEINVSGSWYRTGWAFSSPSSYGVAAHYLQGVGIIVRTAVSKLLIYSYKAGGSAPDSVDDITSAPCRIFIRRIDD